jgi:hypothetical protein
LTPFRALREPDRRRRDEERPFRSKQGTGNKPKNHLTGKARLKPFSDQADDALVTDPVFQEADQPILADAAKGSGDRLPIAGISPLR